MKQRKDGGYEAICNPVPREAEDAARYRWLKEHPNYELTPQFKKGKIVGFTCKPYGSTEYWQYDTINAAIDAAMKEQP